MGWQMRNEGCKSCNVPLMMNQKEELYCVNCYNYYALHDEGIIYLHAGAPLKELGAKPSKLQSSYKDTISSVLPHDKIYVESSQQYAEDEKAPEALNINSAKRNMIETNILPSLYKELTAL